MAYTNRNFTWDFDALKRFYEKYIVKWINSAVSWTDAQKKQARANLGFGDGDIDSKPTPGSDNPVKSGGVYDAVEKLTVETLGDTTIQMPVKANTPTPAQSGDFVFTVDVSGLGIKSGTKITIGFTSELIDNSGVNVYYNGSTSAGTAGNGRGTLAITLAADLETLTFKRVASGIIGTGIVLINLTSESSMYKHFSDEINTTNADIVAADTEIAKIENTSEIERVGEKSFSFSVAKEKYYELPYIPKKGDVLIFTLTANASMRCQISGRSKTGTLWTSTTFTGTTATYEKTIEDADIDKLYLYTGSKNTATEVSVAIKNNHGSSKRLDAVEDSLTSVQSDIKRLNTEIGVPIAVNMNGSNFILPVGTYNASVNVPEGSTVRQNLYIHDSNNVRLAEYTVRSSNDFSIEVPAGAARMYFYLGSSDTTGGNGVTSFTKINDSTVYVDPVNGDDTSITTVKTIGQALKLNKKNIILKDGIYDENTLAMVNGVKIMAEHTGKAVFIPSSSIVLTSDGTLMSGSSKVYQVTVDAAIATEVNKWRYIYQFGVDDPQTAIDNDFRLPVHGDLDYRCDFAAIRHLASIEAVEAADYAAFYIDTANNVLYYSRPSAVSASNYLFVPSSSKLFGSTSGKTFELQGLRIYGLVLSLNDSINAKATDCSVFACGGGGCICFDNVTNLHLLRCEAARGETSYSATTGDGFNSHNSSANRSNFTLEDCWAHDNFNDGYSDHEASEGHIIRGVYEYNCIHHGGGITPAFGAKDMIEGAICQCNKDDGIRYTGDPSSNTTYESLIVKDVLIRNNTNNGFGTTTDTAGNAYVTCINVLSYDNGGYGFMNAGNNTVTCLNCRAVGNHGGDTGYDFSGCENR